MFPRVPLMFTIIEKINQWENTAYATYRSIRTAVAYFFLGDISTDQAPGTKAYSDLLGVGISRIGPPILGSHIVYVLPKGFTPEEIKAHTEFLCDLPGKDSRLPMDICSVTNSSFFFAMNNKAGIKLRNKSKSYLKPATLFSHIPKMMTDLFNELPNYKGSKSRLVERHIFSLFTRALFGFELDEPLFDILSKIMLSRREYILLPRWLWRCVPQYRKIRSEFDMCAKNFLRAHFKSLRMKSSDQQNNMFCHIVLSKLPKNKQINEITDSEIERLIVDPEIRFCITAVIGVENLTKVITASLPQLYYAASAPFLRKIREESLSQFQEEKDIHKIAWSDKEALPNLHAYFLETLRYFAPLPIMRYTASAFSIARLSIPARSVVLYELPFGIRNSFKEGNSFNPGRFLDEFGCLNELAKLQQGVFIPFGDGSRPCLAVKVSEYVFKRCIVEFSFRVKNFNSPEIEFYEKKDQPSIMHCGASLFAQNQKKPQENQGVSRIVKEPNFLVENIELVRNI